MIKTLQESVVKNSQDEVLTIKLIRFVNKAGVKQFRVAANKTLVKTDPDFKSALAYYNQAVEAHGNG